MTCLPDRSLQDGPNAIPRRCASPQQLGARRRLSSIPGPLLFRSRADGDSLETTSPRCRVRRPPPRRQRGARWTATMVRLPVVRAEHQLGALSHLSELLGQHGIEYWLFGGWAVDFHAGKVTRPHDDLDVTVWSNGERAHELPHRCRLAPHTGRGLQRVRARRRSSRGCVCRPRRMASELVRASTSPSWPGFVRMSSACRH